MLPGWYRWRKRVLPGSACRHRLQHSASPRAVFWGGRLPRVAGGRDKPRGVRASAASKPQGGRNGSLVLRLKRFALEYALFFNQFLNFEFGLMQTVPAGPNQGHATFEIFD